MEFKKIQSIAFFALLIGVSIVFLQMIWPYVFALFWAAVIAVIFHPVYKRLLKRLKNESIAASLMVIIVILIVVLPLAGVLTLVIQQAIQIYDRVSEPDTIASIISSAEAIIHAPFVQRITGEVDFVQQLRDASSTIASSAIQWLQAGTRSTLQVIVNILIMIYSLYFFFKDGESWLKRIMHLLPFGDENETVLYKKFVSTSKATLKGTILLGGIQGTLGGLLFLAVGIEAAAFWGLVMIVLSIIPAVGSFLVWFPAAVIMLATGNIWQGVALLIGGVIIGTVDNLLRPSLVGKDIQMHPIWILFSTIGGIVMFGISGVVIGPMIAAFFLGVLNMYEMRYKKNLDSKLT
ncbi:MAG: AI-2E family transporter [Candidatus Kerfeldbacteria bacterium]